MCSNKLITNYKFSSCSTFNIDQWPVLAVAKMKRNGFNDFATEYLWPSTLWQSALNELAGDNQLCESKVNQRNTKSKLKS